MKVCFLVLLLACSWLVAMPVPAIDNVAAARANLQLGVAYLKSGNLGQAKEKLERARDQSSRDAEVRGALALLYSRLGETAKADAEFRNALKFAPANPDALNNYAVFQCEHGQVAEGVAHFEQAAANPLYRTPWAAYTNAGVCLRGAKREAEAEQRFLKALQIRPSHAEAVLQLADMELAAQKPAAAYQRIDTFLAHNLPSADLLYVGWRAAGAMQDKLTAIKLARRLQTDFPDSDQARAVIAGNASGGGNGR
jgi:type IV pilus assembly protein PilF